MKILLPIKRVPDGNAPLRLKADGSGADLAGMPMRINPFDEAALEQAVQWKEAGIASEIIAITIGGEACQDILRHALALGADRAMRVDTASALEPLAVAKLLRGVAEREAPQLILMGKQSSDEDNAQTAPMLAALLGWPQGLFASQLKWEQGRVHITREIEGGQETLALPLPAVVSADLRLANPRYLKLPQLLQAKKKPIETLLAADFGLDLAPQQTLLHVTPPAPRAAAVKLPDAAALLAALKKEGVL